MRQPGRIDDDPVSNTIGLLDRRDQIALAVGLHPVKLVPRFIGNGTAAGLDVGKRVMAVDIRFTRAKHVQIGAIDHGYADRIGHVGKPIIIGVAHSKPFGRSIWPCHAARHSGIGRNSPAFHRRYRVCH